jgi:hypothetical protein
MFFPALLSPHFRTTHPVRQTIYDLPSLSAAAAAIILDARYRPLLALITDMLTLVRPLLAPKPFPLSSNRCPVTFFLPLQGDRSSSHFFRRTGRLVPFPTLLSSSSFPRPPSSLSPPPPIETAGSGSDDWDLSKGEGYGGERGPVY